MKLLIPTILLILSACGQLSRSEDQAVESEQTETEQDGSEKVEQDESAKPSTDASKSEPEQQIPEAEQENQEESASTAEEDGTVTGELEPEPTPCVADPVLAAPTTIEEAVSLINSLPMPVSIVCFLQALQKPFQLVATRSTLSAQPADGEETPRFFLFYDKLIISVVPGGDGKDLVEFSYLVSTRDSVKGELEFPVTASLDAEAAYITSLNSRGTGTRCAVCHGGERPAATPTSDYPQTAYISRAIKPMNSQITPKFILDKISSECQQVRDERCDMLNALLGATYERVLFPETMPTFF